MTESMRVYAAEQLIDTEVKATRDKHFEYFRIYAEKISEHSHLFGDAQARPLFVSEKDNLRLAIEWAFMYDPQGCLHMVVGVGLPWMREARTEIFQLLTRALDAAPEVSDFDHVSARIQLARIKLREASPIEAGMLLATARQQIEEMHDADPGLRAWLMLTAGGQEAFVGNSEHARKLYLEVLDLAEKYNWPWFRSAAHTNLGELCREDNEYEAACRHYEEALRVTNDPLWISNALSNLGSAAIKLDDVARAEESFRKAYALARPVKDRAMTNIALGGLGYVFVKAGRYREAGLLMGYPEAFRKRSGSRLDPVDEALFEEFRALGVVLGGDIYESAFAEGATFSIEQLAEIVDRSAP